MMRVTRRGVETTGFIDTRELVVTPSDSCGGVYGGGPPKRFRVFIEESSASSVTIVPKFWALGKYTTSHRFQDDRSPGSVLSDVVFTGTLKPELHQLEASNAVLESCHTIGGGVLCLGTGFGKTVVALDIACKLRKKTLIIVHKSFLAAQWEDRIRHFVKGATVSKIQGTTCDTSGDFVIAMIQTLITRDYDATIFEDFGLLIVDEAHHMAAKCFSQAMFRLNFPYTIGLTATPDRKDGLMDVILWFLGPVVFSCIENPSNRVTNVDIVKFRCDAYRDPPPLNRQGNVCFASLMTRLTQHEERTLLIAHEIVKHARLGKHVLVLSHRRNHCQEVCLEVRKLMGSDDDDNDICNTYLGGDSTAPTSQVVMSTYAFTSEGFDDPRFNVLVLATPASDVRQACGRVMRGAGESLIVDIADCWSVCFAQRTKRVAFYKKSKFRIR